VIVVKIAFIAFAAYFFVLIIVRLAGRKTMSQLTFFDFILGVTLGTLTANMVLGPDRIAALITLICIVDSNCRSFAYQEFCFEEGIELRTSGFN